MPFSPVCCSVLHMWPRAPAVGKSTSLAQRSMHFCVFPFLYFIHTSIILFQSQFFPSTLHLTAPSLLPNLCHYRQLSPYSLSPQHFCDFIAVLSLVAICPFLSSVAEAEVPGRRLHLERWGKKSPSGSASAINLPPRRSFVHPHLLSFTIASSVSLLYLCLSVFPTPALPL